MTTSKASDFFAARVAEYDSFMTRGCPRYHEMLGELRAVLPGTAVDILELGCGTGPLTMNLAERYPDARLTVVDGAVEMTEMARLRLQSAHPAVARRATFVASMFEELRLQDGTYDLITSSMSLHHIVDKQPFYASLRAALSPGGKLVFADELVVADPEIQRQYWDWWLDFARRAGGLTEAEIQDCIEHMNAFDRYETLPKQLEMLTGAGFEDVDCVWRFLNYAVFVATRPA
jgi:tRNA (cmo5U34)-methyltransferase